MLKYIIKYNKNKKQIRYLCYKKEEIKSPL